MTPPEYFPMMSEMSCSLLCLRTVLVYQVGVDWSGWVWSLSMSAYAWVSVLKGLV